MTGLSSAASQLFTKGPDYVRPRQGTNPHVVIHCPPSFRRERSDFFVSGLSGWPPEGQRFSSGSRCQTYQGVTASALPPHFFIRTGTGQRRMALTPHRPRYALRAKKEGLFEVPITRLFRLLEPATCAKKLPGGNTGHTVSARKEVEEKEGEEILF
jgi:hypothetical protein